MVIFELKNLLFIYYYFLGDTHPYFKAFRNQGPYSPTVLKNILCLFLQDLWIWMQDNFWLAKPYGLANQKLCYIQMQLNIEKSVEQD